MAKLGGAVVPLELDRGGAVSRSVGLVGLGKAEVIPIPGKDILLAGTDTKDCLWLWRTCRGSLRSIRSYGGGNSKEYKWN